MSENQPGELPTDVEVDADPLTMELPDPEGDLDEEPAEVQDQSEVPDEQEAALGKIKAHEFARAAGVKLEELFRDVLFEHDGKEVSLSEVFDNAKSLKDAQQALLRERTELKQKAEQAATAMPQGQYSPMAQNLIAQAQAYMQALQTTDWSQVDPAEAANQKFDLQNRAQMLAAQAQQEQAAWGQQMSARMQQARMEADRITRSKIPEWNDQQTFARDWRELGDLAHSYGVQQSELEAVVDPRFRHMLHDFLKLKRGEAKIQAGARKVRKISKTLGAGSRTQQPSGQMTPEQVRKAIKQAPDERTRAKLRMTLPLPE